MRVQAPGKLLLTGAYAVLEGAPAIVLAVDRYAFADASQREAHPSAEVRAALGASPAPAVDTRALYDAEGNKLGLGSSAAALVASLGAVAAMRGEDLRREDVRTRLFDAARRAHARAQAGGSGVDVAASVFGGVLRYQLRDAAADVRPVVLPQSLVVAAFWTGTSARTSDLRARVDALRARDRASYEACWSSLTHAAKAADEAVAGTDGAAFVRAAHATGAALASLGRAADAPICTPSMSDLARRAEMEDAAFLPSGAGGGDVAIYVGMARPSPAFLSLARASGMKELGLRPDPLGVCLTIV